MQTMERINLGETLKNYRLKKKLTLEKLSEITGLSISYLSYIESNGRKPNLEVLSKIANGLQIPVELILLLSMNSDEPLIKEKLLPLIREIADELLLKNKI
jgi:XRE family transcriptional regulator, regulator of sulfur utilization